MHCCRGSCSLLQPLDGLFLLESNLCRVFLGIIGSYLLNESSVPGSTAIRNNNPVIRVFFPNLMSLMETAISLLISFYSLLVLLSSSLVVASSDVL
jgi:hypothetical protein